MSRTTHHRISLIALSALGLGAVLVPSAAQAESAQVMQLAKGIGGPDGKGLPLKNATPGTEQSYSTAIPMGDKTYVITVWMSGDVTGNDRPNELKCSSVEIDKIAGMKLVVDAKQITKGDANGDREGNHPVLATDGKNVVFVYGSDIGSNQVATYAGVLDNMCNVVTKAVKISQNGNNNEGAPEIAYAGNGNFVTGYLSGGQDVIGVGLKLNGTTLTQTFHTNLINPANIGRPVMAIGAADRTLFCAAQGDQRPPEDGIACAWINTLTGKAVVSSKIIAPSNPAQKIYMNQPTVATLDAANGIFAVGYQESNGAGKNNNTKGANTSHLMILKANDAGFQMMVDKTGLAASQSHASICAGDYGNTGERVIGVMGSPITGVGTPTLQIVHFNPATMSLVGDAIADRWAIGFHGDAGHLSNIYGQNPKTQGRDFLKCTADIANPGHGVAGGWMSNVASFFLAPHSGRLTGDPKNALFLSLVPAKTDKPTPPTDPTAVPQAGTATAGSGTPTTTGTGVTDPATTGAGVVTDPPPVPVADDPKPPFNEQPQGCACSVPGSSESGEGNIALALSLGLALAVAARRKAS
jgi:hypothetical protein